MTVMTAMTSMALAQSSGDTGFSFGTLLLFVGGAVLLAFFCSIGLIARMREHKIDQRKEAAAAARKAAAAAASNNDGSGGDGEV